MKISAGIVEAQSSYSYTKVESSSVKITTEGRLTLQPSQTAAPAQNKPEAEPQRDTLDLTDDAKKLMEESRKQLEEQLLAAKAQRPVGRGPDIESPEQMKLRLIELMFSRFDKRGRRPLFEKVGHTTQNLDDALNPNKQNSSANSISSKTAKNNALCVTPNISDANRLDIGTFSRTQIQKTEYERFFYENESVSYNAQGLVKTEDGKEIRFDVSMSMSRTVYENLKLTFEEERQLCDPLVINYKGDATKLTDEKFAFDLDLDGAEDMISFAGAGSGFLALDKNGDGKIGDGSELFGPRSGNGFGELRAYDNDRNGWIDENDDVYSKLRVWAKDKDGNDQLFTLKELDIGAIHLNDLPTQFNLGEGQLQSTSFFLKDGGGAGTISHIDLRV